MLWSLAGAAAALAIAAAAWRRSRSAGGFYDREIYGMSARSHRRYAALSLLFAGYFAVTAARHLDAAGIAGLALYAVIAVFYVTSFLQGAPDRDE
jgi:hypothetical protein